MTALLKSILIFLSLLPAEDKITVGDCTMFQLKKVYRADTTFYIAENAVKCYKAHDRFYLANGEMVLEFKGLDPLYGGGGYYLVISWYRRGAYEYLYVYPRLENDSPMYTTQAGRVAEMINGKVAKVLHPESFHEAIDICMILDARWF